MARNWLLAIDGRGLLVSVPFMEQLRKGNKAAHRKLAQPNLTALYRNGYSSLRADQRLGPGLLWTDEMPPSVLIPFIRGGAHPQGPWIPNFVWMVDKLRTRMEVKQSLACVRDFQTYLPADERPFIQITEKMTKVTTSRMKPNPRFELVVVNKYDRAALLKLLAEVDSRADISTWLGKCTMSVGATRFTPLFEDYQAWCERQGETPVGKKTFAHRLVSQGVVKLRRGSGGERYQLTLQP